MYVQGQLSNYQTNAVRIVESRPSWRRAQSVERHTQSESRYWQIGRFEVQLQHRSGDAAAIGTRGMRERNRSECISCVTKCRDQVQTGASESHVSPVTQPR